MNVACLCAGRDADAIVELAMVDSPVDNAIVDLQCLWMILDYRGVVAVTLPELC